MDHENRRGPGRPRSESSHRRILEAATRLLERDGYTRLTIDALAAEAGVGRQTIYRRWRTKADVVLELVADRPDFAVAVPDTGSYGRDIREFLQSAFAAASDPPTADLLRGLMTEAQERPDFGHRFRHDFLGPRRAAFQVIVDRAAARQDLPSHVASEAIADIAFGSLWYRLLATREPLDAQYADAIARALAPPEGPTGA
ncbi:TetR/AcrR family transcriptional regulator [Amnibacterium kyonggiense]